MLYNCYSLSSLPDISKWNTNNVNDMSEIFSNCHYYHYLIYQNGILLLLKV